MKFFFDLFPVILFFGAYTLSGDIYLATKVAMAASVLQIIYSLIRHRTVPKMLALSCGLVIVLGGITLYFHNPHFIMWKPTLLFWAMAAGLLGSILTHKNGLRLLLEKQMTLPDQVWARGNIACILFLTVMGALNLYIAYNFNENIWVNFKLFGIFGMNLAFLVLLLLYLSRFNTQEEESE